MHLSRTLRRCVRYGFLLAACTSAPTAVCGQVNSAASGGASEAQTAPGPALRLGFDGSLVAAGGSRATEVDPSAFSYVPGVDGQALRVAPGSSASSLELTSTLPSLGSGQDFSVRFWVRTEAEAGQRFVLLSRKEFDANSLASQRNAGWVFYVSDGTWAWNVGSGDRRLTYERDNGYRMPLNDGRWHQLAMTYRADLDEIRLFYDGVNWVSYHVADADGFDFSSNAAPTVGWNGDGSPGPELLPSIEAGAEQLQAFVDAFNALGQRPIQSDEFLRLIVDPGELFEARAGREASADEWAPVEAAETALMDNPYTIHQALEFMEAAPLTKIYALIDGQIIIRRDMAARYAERERLSEPDFAMDDLAIWDRALTADEVRASYAEHFELVEESLENDVSTLTAGVWNIWHGGQHFTAERHGWDSRVRVAEAIEGVGADIVMMQETYSSGDFIAAELGYHLATTVDWDYLNQGANISVLSRYPIRDVHVDEDSPFNNVGTTLAISETQDLHVISNWYGMGQFPSVFDFHGSRFAESDHIPTLFGGDFNAIPHTDGGESPASRTLLNAGFIDAFRSLHPDVEEWPGPTHTSGRRIDQLYYRGSGLINRSTRVISTWDRGFPSDHFLIVSQFDLNYRSR